MNSRRAKGPCRGERSNCGALIKSWGDSILAGKEAKPANTSAGLVLSPLTQNWNPKSLLLLSCNNLTEGTLEWIWSFSREKFPPCSSKAFCAVKGTWGRSLPLFAKCYIIESNNLGQLMTGISKWEDFKDCSPKQRMLVFWFPLYHLPENQSNCKISLIVRCIVYFFTFGAFYFFLYFQIFKVLQTCGWSWIVVLFIWLIWQLSRANSATLKSMTSAG